MRSYWNLKLSDVVRGVIGVLLFVPSFAQFSKPDAEKATSQETYLFPIKPGQPASLAGTMGELRATHFHSGIDIRTNNEIGWPVLAAKSGYVSRVSMSGTGYGNVLYITHPDGHVTLYAHLEKVNGALGDYVLRERYRRKSAEIDLYFRKGQFPVQRGDTIALSGNTGSSGGPHLHFDIRDSEDHALDPLTFGFKEVKDITPPHAQKIALKTMDMDSRVNDQFGRFEFYLARVGKDYTFSAPILARGHIGIEVLGYDRLELNQFKTGINFIEVYVNGQMTFCQTIERIDLAETRNIYTLMDFRVMRFNGNKFYKLYLDDGSRQNFYEKSPGDGIIPIDPAKTTSVRIVLKDTDGNSSDVTFRLQPSAPTTSIVALDAPREPGYEFLENTLVIQSPPCDTAITAYANGKALMIPKAYGSTKKSVFLANLKTTRLDSAVVCGKTLHTQLVATVPSGTAYRYYSDRMDLTFPEQALYDTLYLQARHVSAADSSSEIFSIGSYYTPLHRSVEITLKPVLHYPRTEQVSVYRKVGAGYAWAGGTWGPDRVTFFTRDLGDYTILVDSVAPVIKPVYVNNVAVRFKIRDNLSGIKSYEANINGQWLLMNFDAKTATLYSERSSDTQLLKGTFELMVTDNAGNKSVYKQHIPFMALKIGDQAPDFSVNDQQGNPVSLRSLRGQKVVLYFYPKDQTPGCTAEACNLRDNYKALQKQGYEVLGVSTDDEKSHQKFIAKEKLPFTLLADVNKALHHQYGTWVEKSMYGRKYMGTARVTFVIDEKGVISDIIEKVDTKNHAAQILSPGTNGKAAQSPKKAPKPRASAKTVKKAATKKTSRSKPAKKTAAKKKTSRKK